MQNIRWLLSWLLNKETAVLSLRSCQRCYGELCQIHLLSTKTIHTSDGGSKSYFLEVNTSFNHTQLNEIIHLLLHVFIYAVLHHQYDTNTLVPLNAFLRLK